MGFVSKKFFQLRFESFDPCQKWGQRGDRPSYGKGDMLERNVKL